jgi:hypothetical protein
MTPLGGDELAHFLFLASSGRDGGASPYEVLAGVAVQDRDTWNLVQALGDAQFRHFGRSLRRGESAARARVLLKPKTFRLAAQARPLPADERRMLALACLDDGAGAGRRELTALAQSRLAYAGEALELCARYRCRFVASITGRGVPRASGAQPRRDFLYLFERFFYLLDDLNPPAPGVVVCREGDGGLAALAAEQMERYFKSTAKGRQRTGLVIPEPLVARGELTRGNDMASLVAYVTAWGFRTRELTAPARRDLYSLKEQVRALRYRAIREMGDNPNFIIWGFSVVSDLRSDEEREPVEVS